jgi:hypothetical protein
VNFKTVTHYIALGVAALAGFAVTPAGQALVTQYPKLSMLFAAVGAIAALYHNPTKATG